MKLLKNDLIAKYPNTHPYKKLELDKLIIDITSPSSNPLSIVYFLLYLTGQFPHIKKAKNSVASFKLRKGMPIGGLTTLRSSRLINFIKLLSIVYLPHLAASYPGEESIKKGQKTPSISLGIKDMSILTDPLLSNSPYKIYSGGGNIQFIPTPYTTLNQNMFILSYYLIPFKL